MNISIGHPSDYLDVTLRIDREGAEYIATVMREEWQRSNDRGAKAIADNIDRAFSSEARP